MLRAYILPFAVLLFCTACQSDQSAATTDEDIQQYTIEQFMDNESLFGSSFSPDGSRILVTSDRSGIFNAYTIPVTGGDPEPVTNSDSSSVYGVSYFPDDERIILQMDNNGDELFQLFIRNTDGTVQSLTGVEGSRATFYGWAHDGESFYVGWNQRDNRFMDVYEVPVATLEPQMLFEMQSGENFGGISPNERYMAIVVPITTSDTDLFIHDFETDSRTKVNTMQGGFSPTDFSVDNQYLYYTTDADGEFSKLYRYDIQNGERTEVESADWDITYAYFSHGGTYRVAGINADGKTEIRLFNTTTTEAVPFPEFEAGDIQNINISRDEAQMTFYVGSSASPSNLYVYDFSSGDYQQLSNTLNPEIEANDLVTAEVVRFKSFDDLEIPAIYYKPKQASPDSQVAALVWVHGGPGGQSRQSYNAQLQYFVNHGYAILAVNNRGSSGYGKTFYKMDDQRHGEEDLRDVIAGRDWLAQQSYIDSTQIGILGGSYGGYMVMRAMTHTPDAFEVGIDIFGVTNWLRTLRSIPPWWESFKDALYEEMGDPNSADSVRLYNISPLFHADQVKNPVMVLQGAQDPRVLQVESDEMVEAIREQGVPVEYVVFEDEGHGFRKKENRIEAYGKVLEFLDRYLKQKELKG